MRIFLGILAMALATLITRALPFVFFKRIKPPLWLLTTAKLIPGAVMITLVLTSVPFPGANINYLPWIGIAIVAILHLAFKHPLISIFGGTGLYMIISKIMM